MMKTLILYIIFFAILLTYSCTTVNNKLSIEAMKNDIDSLVCAIEEIHINPYYKYPKKDFYHEIDSLKKNLTKPKDPIEFWTFIAPTIVKLEDGHTFVQFPYNYFKKLKPLIFPFNVRTSNKPPYISIINGDIIIPSKSEIVSINGISSSELISKFIKYESGEDEQSRAEWIANSFECYLYAICNITDECMIEFRTNDTFYKKNLKFITLSEFKERQKNIRSNDNDEIEPYNLKVITEISTAIIDFKSFEGIEKMKEFSDSTFNLIKKQKINNLIIDIRENGGGDSGVGDELLQYLAKTDFKQYSDQTFIKSSRQLKRKLNIEKENILNTKKFSVNDSLYLNEIERVLATSGGNVTICHYAKNSIKLRNQINNFTGNLYLLCSKKTFSSASDFAQTIKAYNLGVIVGEETGGWIVCYGDIVTDLLPNSDLMVGVSSVKFVNVGAKKDDWHGVLPDIVVPAEESMDYVLNMIKEKN